MGFSRDPCSSKLLYITITFPEMVCIHWWFQQSTWNGSTQYLNVSDPMYGVNISKPWNADLTTLFAHTKATPRTLHTSDLKASYCKGRPLYFFTLSILLLYTITAFAVGWDNVVGIATGYGMESPEFQPRAGEGARDFPNSSSPALGPTQPI